MRATKDDIRRFLYDLQRGDEKAIQKMFDLFRAMGRTDADIMFHYWDLLKRSPAEVKELIEYLSSDEE